MTETNNVGRADAELLALRERNSCLEAELQETRDTADRRFIQSELKGEALRRGIIDLDGLKLVDPQGLKIGAAGDVQGVEAVVTKLQKDKPWLFSPGNSSSLAGVPASVPSGNKQAIDMSLAEWRAARADLLRRK
jgi:hypothetical protein